jgi:UDP-glucuronate 4-epimerase
MASTFADTSELEKVVGFKPLTPIETGVSSFANWYREFYRPA